MKGNTVKLRCFWTGLLLIAFIAVWAKVYAADTYPTKRPSAFGAEMDADEKADSDDESTMDDDALSTRRLNKDEVERLLEDGSSEDQRRLFKRLSPEQKSKAFEYFSLKERVMAFKWLNRKEKQMVFTALEDQARVELFSRLDDRNQKLIFRGLEDRTKARILSGMKQEQRRKWMVRYPGLRLLMSDEASSQDLPSLESLKKPRKKGLIEEKEKPSRIESVMSGIFPQTIKRNLTQFGYDFFETAPPAFRSLTDVPVGEEYILGPGDSFIIHLWGKVEDEYPVTVSSEGAIMVPRIGSLTVAQLTFKEAKQLLNRKFKEYYPQFTMSLTMDRLRTIQVFVIGEVKRPGTYRVSGLSTIIDALYASGGPRKTGSLRNIKVTRNADTLATLDLYSFLIDGHKGEDIRLRSGDTVFVPVIGTVAGIAGNVRRPAIYEIKKATSIGELFELSGGVMPTGHLQNVVVERIAKNRRRIIKSFNLDESSDSGDEQMDDLLADGDVVKVFPVHRQMRQVVFLEGHVKYPQEYEYRPGMRVGDVIASYDMLLPEPYLQRAEIIRLVPPDHHPEIIELDLGALLEGDGSQNVALQDMDRIVVYDITEKMNLPQVTIGGAVRRPGTYRLHEGMRVKDLIFRADNLLPGAFMGKASLARVAVGKERTDVVSIEFSPKEAIAGNPEDDIELRSFDSVYIREIPRYNEAMDRKITLEGEFQFPGEYAFAEGERLSAVIARAGGLTEESYLYGAVYLREDVKALQKKRIKEYVSQLEEEVLTLTSQSAETSLQQDEAEIIMRTLTSKKLLLEKMKSSEPTGRMIVDLEKVAMDPNSDHDLKIQPGDRLIVKKRPDYVNVLGEVYNPTALLATGDRTVGYYLNQVGGAADNADEDQMYLVKANGTVISKRQEGFWGIANWDTENRRWSLGSFEDMTVNSGDTIIVPKKVEKYPWLRIVKSITEITFQIAVTAGVIIAAF
jgi:protein involved in polysaccharide export with SLBB domain